MNVSKKKQNLSCSINNSSNNTENYTCFNKNSLLKIAKNLKIKTSNLKKKQLWNEINNTLNCNNEKCWINKIDKTIINKFYKPLIPKGKYKWLTNNDIDMVLNQYNDSNFKFFGAIPSDYFHFNKIPKKISSQNNAIIFNLDKSHQKGSHWIAIFIDNKNKIIEYFDSTGYDIDNKDIKNFFNHNTFKNYTKKINKNKHQINNSECGIYTIFYITNRLNGKSFEDLSNNIIHDKQMNKNRQKFFRSF